MVYLGIPFAIIFVTFKAHTVGKRKSTKSSSDLIWVHITVATLFVLYQGLTWPNDAEKHALIDTTVNMQQQIQSLRHSLVSAQNRQTLDTDSSKKPSRKDTIRK